MIAVGEASADRRRIYFLVRDVDGQLVENATDFAAGDLITTVNGAPFAAAPGALGVVGGGLHYYEATAGQVAAGGFLFVMLNGSGYLGYGWDTIGRLWTIGEDDPTLLRLPIAIYDVDNALVAGVEVDADLAITTNLNGAAPAAAAGALHAIAGGAGIYYYQGVEAEAATRGRLAIAVTSSLSAIAHAYTTIDSVLVAGDDAAAPQTTLVSPPAGAIAGSYEDVLHTELVLDVSDDNALAYLAVFAAFGDSVNRVPVYRRGEFEPGFSAHSYVEELAPDAGVAYRVHVRRDAGWPPGDVALSTDPVDAGGNVGA
jgi:hypothetical protein